MNRCSQASFESRKNAIDAKRSMLRRFRSSHEKAPELRIGYCESCDKYHITANTLKYPFTKGSVMILQCIAQGYRDRETAEIVTKTEDTISWEVIMMMRRFNALSRANLVAIVIALGIINPNDFVPIAQEHAVNA
jgi:DNA-binding NarL/FixJ family response regulator